MDIEEITDFKKIKSENFGQRAKVTISKKVENDIKKLNSDDQEELCAMAYFQSYRAISDNTQARNGPVTRIWIQDSETTHNTQQNTQSPKLPITNTKQKALTD